MVAAFAFANKGRVSVDAVDCGVVKDVELTVSAEHVPLFGWGSILRQAVARHTAKTAVKIGYMKLDPTVTTGWQFSMMRPAGATGVLDDVNTVKTFTIVADFVFESGTTLRGTVTGVYFPAFPLKAAEGQWVKVDMTGEGADVTFTNP
jgi:hypothetical protein